VIFTPDKAHNGGEGFTKIQMSPWLKPKGLYFGKTPLQKLFPTCKSLAKERSIIRMGSSTNNNSPLVKWETNPNHKRPPIFSSFPSI
jgi:hypothetical protein